jgi:hypothetical protein
MKAILALSVVSAAILPLAALDVPSNIDTVTGYSGQRLFNPPPAVELTSPEACRQYGLNRRNEFAGWGWRPREIWTRRRQNCFMLLRPFRGSSGNPNDLNGNILGCFNPGEKVGWGCSTASPEDNRPWRIFVNFPQEGQQKAAAISNIDAQVSGIPGVTKRNRGLVYELGMNCSLCSP